MRQRRDPFARITYVPTPLGSYAGAHTACAWCGATPAPRRPLREIRQESDGGRTSTLSGVFCSWSCAESYHGSPLGGS